MPRGTSDIMPRQYMHHIEASGTGLVRNNMPAPGLWVCAVPAVARKPANADGSGYARAPPAWRMGTSGVMLGTELGTAQGTGLLLLLRTAAIASHLDGPTATTC